jgi:hypothetical protein
MIGFIVFILAYMVASLSYDVFFHFLTAGMFILSLWIMHEVQLGQKEQLAKKELECEEKIAEIQEKLDQTEATLQALIRSITIANDHKSED